MKNSTRLLYLATAIAGISFSQSASATILGNNYEGASSVTSNGTSYGDVAGNVNDFGINYTDVSLVGNILKVSIDTIFVGNVNNNKNSSRLRRKGAEK